MVDNQEVTVPGRERRRYSRTVTTGDAQIVVPDGRRHRTITGQISDVSPSGVRFKLETQHVLQLGDQATVVWDIPPQLGYTLHPRSYKFTGSIVRVDSTDGASYTLGIKFTRLIPEQVQRVDTRPERTGAVTVAILVAAGICVLKAHNVMYYWWAPIANAYSLLVCSYVYLRVMMSMFYKEPKDVGYMPTVSLIISAKNEEKHIRETVRHAIGSRYPKDLLEVIVVDDGSTDKTPAVLTELSAEIPNLRVFRHSENKGKRYAMATGALEAANDILVFVDSDSLVDEEGVYRLVQPFHDKAIGAVAGEISVVVEPDNFFSKMEVVRYQISQRVIKASESLFNAVTCCSGPFAAYRRVSVLRVLPEWLNQTFAGERTTFGDDRSLTNFILRTHRVIFHHGAICRTYVPETWTTYFRQQLRWKKSWARESIIASTFMWRKHPLAAIPFYVGILITLFSPLVALRALFYLPVFLSVSPLPYLTGLTLINVLLACVFFYYTRSRYWPYILAFVGLYIGALCWQTYYAIVTIPRNHWGSR